MSLPQLKNQWYFIDNAYEYGYPAETVHFTATHCVDPELRKSLTSCDEDKRLLSFISSPELVPTFILEVKAPQTTTSSTAVVEASRVEGEIVSEPRAPSHIQKVHPPL
jgi:hypothetical protein